jgi:hypothetical protein
MRTHPGDPHSLGATRSARELLGAEHPLARVEARLNVALTGSAVVAALLCAGVAALLDGLSVGLSLTVAAALAQTILAARVALLLESRREHVLDLIIEGRGDLPIAAVERQRRRLLDPARRRGLASAFEEIRDEALRPPARDPRMRPIFDRRVIAAVAPELTTIAALLRDDVANLRGIALAQRLVTDGISPLYRSDVRLLRDELRRLEYHLQH